MRLARPSFNRRGNGRAVTNLMETVMKYMLLIYANEAQWPTMTQEQMGQAMAAYGAYTEAITASGVRLASDRLRPTTTATSVRIVNGETKVLDGPYAESKEQ